MISFATPSTRKVDLGSFCRARIIVRMQNSNFSFDIILMLIEIMKNMIVF